MLTTGTGFAKKPTYHGVIIGCCEEYQDPTIQGLNSKKDAISFYNKLVNMYYNGDTNRASQNIHLLIEKSATAINIKNTLKKVAKKAQKGDVVYFFYSGHGSSLDNPKNFIAPTYKNNELIKVMENSGLIVPYNFNFNQVGKTAIIGKRDLKDNHGYGFKYLDNNGVQVIMINDSCYAGNIYRTGKKVSKKAVSSTKLNLESDEELRKFKAKANKPKHREDYKNLIFFSAGGTTNMVGEDDRLQRGKFSLVLEKCLLIANQNGDGKITKKELQECLHSEDLTKGFVMYPPEGQLANKAVFKSKQKVIPMNQKDKIRIKTSLMEIAQMSNEIVIDNQNYDIEIIKTDNQYQIFKYTGEKYAKVNIKDLQTYLNSLKLFKLKGKSKLDVKVSDTYKRKEMGQFCDGEELTVDITSPNYGKYVVALTLDREGKVIMLQPNNQNGFSSRLLKTKAKYPFGMDKIKVFALTNQAQYNKVKKLVFTGGELESYAINSLYKTLKSNKNYKEAEMDIETIDKPLNYCRQGD